MAQLLYGITDVSEIDDFTNDTLLTDKVYTSLEEAIADAKKQSGDIGRGPICDGFRTAVESRRKRSDKVNQYLDRLLLVEKTIREGSDDISAGSVKGRFHDAIDREAHGIEESGIKMLLQALHETVDGLTTDHVKVPLVAKFEYPDEFSAPPQLKVEYLSQIGYDPKGAGPLIRHINEHLRNRFLHNRLSYVPITEMQGDISEKIRALQEIDGILREMKIFVDENPTHFEIAADQRIKQEYDELYIRYLDACERSWEVRRTYGLTKEENQIFNEIIAQVGSIAHIKSMVEIHCLAMSKSKHGYINPVDLKKEIRELNQENEQEAEKLFYGEDHWRYDYLMLQCKRFKEFAESGQTLIRFTSSIDVDRIEAMAARDGGQIGPYRKVYEQMMDIAKDARKLDNYTRVDYEEARELRRARELFDRFPGGPEGRHELIDGLMRSLLGGVMGLQPP